jgi:hypothetical protein
VLGKTMLICLNAVGSMVLTFRHPERVIARWFRCPAGPASSLEARSGPCCSAGKEDGGEGQKDAETIIVAAMEMHLGENRQSDMRYPS